MDEKRQREVWADFDRRGVAHVRDHAQQWQGELRDLAYRWLEERSAASEARSQALQVASARSARIANIAAIVAATAAVIAIPIAIIAIVVSYFAWRNPTAATPTQGRTLPAHIPSTRTDVRR